MGWFQLPIGREVLRGRRVRAYVLIIISVGHMQNMIIIASCSTVNCYGTIIVLNCVTISALCFNTSVCFTIWKILLCMNGQMTTVNSPASKAPVW